MREIGLMLVALLAASKGEAGVKEIAEGAGPQASSFLYGIVTIVVIGAIGLIGNVILSLFDESKIARILNKATYFSCAGVLVVMAIGFIGTIASAIEKFIHLVSG